MCFGVRKVLQSEVFDKCQSFLSQVSVNKLDRVRDVGSISNLGGARRLEGTFSLKKGTFSEIKRALLCLLQSLGRARAPSASLGNTNKSVSHSQDFMAKTTSQLVQIIFFTCLLVISPNTGSKTSV